MGNSTSYEQDFFAWTFEQARLLREGRAADADLPNIAEELETLGRVQRRELVNRLAVLLLHLLKWEYQPDRQGKSWRLTITEQRDAIAEHLSDNPSLRASEEEALSSAYKTALRRVEQETDLPKGMFPANCPFTMAQALDEAFWPSLD